MGLENGIVVIPKSKRAKEFCEDAFEDYREDDPIEKYEICYWRKYWSLNDEILEYLHKNYSLKENRFYLTLKDLSAIMNILKRNISYDYYKDNVRCLWEYPAYARNLGDNIFELSRLIDELEYEEYDEEEEIKIYYYNSF